MQSKVTKEIQHMGRATHVDSFLQWPAFTSAISNLSIYSVVELIVSH